MAVDIFLNTATGLQGAAELRFGLHELRRDLGETTELGDWHDHALAQAAPTPAELLPRLRGAHVLLVLNPALIAPRHLLPELMAVQAATPEGWVQPADPRLASGLWQIDYASRAGFERYVARRQALPPTQPAPPGHTPWVALAPVPRLRAALAKLPEADWPTLLRQLPGPALIAQRAFVHSYAGYQQADRREMLDLLPPGMTRLLDVGGGEGGFALAFQQQRPHGQAALVEPNAQASELARQHGVRQVHQLPFEQVDAAVLGQPFDCISFLDVLEHLTEPLPALQHAASLLPAGGHVLLSVPNAGHWSVVQDLLQGRFDYLPLGILCCTHVRFFTERSLRRLVADAGLSVVRWRNQPSPMPADLAKALHAAQAAGLPLDTDSLGTDAFHVLAVKP
jgi:2-polyprenyl-3-methyl-5-hydroxy-6-metoxy-1,4-benzoquinol methylase